MVQSPPPGRTCGPFSPTRENLWSSLLHQGEPVAQSPPPGRTCGPASPSRENMWSASSTFENRDSASYTRETLRSCLPHQGESAVLSPLRGKPVAQPPPPERSVVLSSPPGRACGPGSTSVRISQPSTNDRLLGYWFCRSNNEWTSKIRLDIRRFT